MSFLDRLPTPADRPRFNPQPKGLPHQLAKEAKDKTDAEKAKVFRDEVWARDQGRCRATGKPLLRSGSTSWDKLGEVDHCDLRSLAPARIYDTSNGLLLMKRLNRLRKVACPKAPQYRMFDYTGPKNRALPQHFVWRNDEGRITKEREG